MLNNIVLFWFLDLCACVFIDYYYWCVVCGVNVEKISIVEINVSVLFIK